MRIAVVGLGLIGGSLALAATARGDEIWAYDADPDAGRIGLERGAVARVDDSLEGALDGAELAFVCGPVAELPSLARQVLDAACWPLWAPTRSSSAAIPSAGRRPAAWPTPGPSCSTGRPGF
jgi:nucleoside-diphosphate-sugar epimerase